jgi:spore coat polysaccharide biosynthesis predicted glycosyltransferase SpsG
MVPGVRVGIRCDAGVRIGVGHLIRCVALAEELVLRGAEVVFLGSLDGPAWVGDQLGKRRLPLVPAHASPLRLTRQALRMRLDAMVIDSYVTDPACAESLRQAGVTVLVIVDGDTRGQRADLYVDQNLGAEKHDPPADGVRLAGVRYVMLRDSVRALRPPAAPRGDLALCADTGRKITSEMGAPRMVCFLGGTDAANAAPAVIELAAATGAPFAATVVAAREATAKLLADVPLAPGQCVTPIPPTDGLPAAAAAADLVVSAAGTSTWELLCLGVPTALIRVAVNQRVGYDATVSRGLAAGLGSVAAPAPDAVAVLRCLLTDPGARAALAARGYGLIDGRGRERVADALLSSCGSSCGEPGIS